MTEGSAYDWKMLRIGLTAVLIALLTIGCSRFGCPDEKVVLVVRHADRDGEMLNDKGKERALALRDLVANYGKATAVIYTTVERTRQTLEPIIESDHPAEFKFEPDNVQAIAGAAREGSGPEVIVIAAHSNTVRPILEEFDRGLVEQSAGAWFPCEGEICHSDYNDLWLVTICGDEATNILKSDYGAPTPEE